MCMYLLKFALVWLDMDDYCALTLIHSYSRWHECMWIAHVLGLACLIWMSTAHLRKYVYVRFRMTACVGNLHGVLEVNLAELRIKVTKEEEAKEEKRKKKENR